MIKLREGDRHGIVFQLQGVDNTDLYAFGRHRLSGTPYTLEGAMMVVADLAVRNCWTNSRAVDENALEAIVEGDVIAYLSEDVDGDLDDADIDDEALSKMCINSDNAILELYTMMAADIIDVVERTVDVERYVEISEFRTEGRRSLIIVVEGS